jgi:outer membrane protein W
VGLDMPLSNSAELCIGLRKVDMTLQVKRFFDNDLEKDKAKLNPAVWFLTLSFHF